MTEQRVVRMWTGVVRTEDRDAYVNYVERTGMEAYRATKGNLDAWLLTRDLGDGRTEITTVSRWESLEASAEFAKAARMATNVRERDVLFTRAASLGAASG